MRAVQIVHYQPIYQDQLRQLIISIQRDEFSIPITLEDQPDLFNIEHFYQKDNGAFLLALDGEKVVGTGALIDLGNQNGALRKFFVHPDYRGKNSAASSLLQRLLKWGQEKDFQDFYLGTTAKFLAAHRFYEKNGFREISIKELPEEFSIMAVDTKFYRLTFSAL